MSVPNAVVYYLLSNDLPASNTHGISGRLQNKLIGKLNGTALKRAFKVVGDNDGLDISGEYGRLEIAVLLGF